MFKPHNYKYNIKKYNINNKKLKMYYFIYYNNNLFYYLINTLN